MYFLKLMLLISLHPEKMYGLPYAGISITKRGKQKFT